MNEKKLSLVLALSLVILDTTWFTACSRSTKVETSESSQVVSDGNPGSRQSYSHSEERTTETKKEPSSDCSGVLSCAVDTLGSIIAFPFKAVGALVGAIF